MCSTYVGLTFDFFNAVLSDTDMIYSIENENLGVDWLSVNQRLVDASTIEFTETLYPAPSIRQALSH